MMYRAVLTGVEKTEQSFSSYEGGLGSWISAMLKKHPKGTAQVFEETTKLIRVHDASTQQGQLNQKGELSV